MKLLEEIAEERGMELRNLQSSSEKKKRRNELTASGGENKGCGDRLYEKKYSDENT